MIGVYAGVSVKPEHVEEFLKTIEPLVTASSAATSGALGLSAL